MFLYLALATVLLPTHKEKYAFLEEPQEPLANFPSLIILTL